MSGLRSCPVINTHYKDFLRIFWQSKGETHRSLFVFVVRKSVNQYFNTSVFQYVNPSVCHYIIKSVRQYFKPSIRRYVSHSVHQFFRAFAAPPFFVPGANKRATPPGLIPPCRPRPAQDRTATATNPPNRPYLCTGKESLCREDVRREDKSLSGNSFSLYRVRLYLL